MDEQFFCTEREWYKRNHCSMWGHTQCLACRNIVRVTTRKSELGAMVRKVFDMPSREEKQ